MRLRWAFGLLAALGLTWIGWCIGCEEAAEAPVPRLTVSELFVISPHSPAIQEAFADGFRRWQQERDPDHAITIRWTYKGTLECQRYIYDRYAQFPDGAKPQCGLDVFFGGGLAIHEDIAARGYSQKLKLPPDMLAAIPAELNGQPLYDRDGAWFGSALGGYGILFNKQACAARGVPEPSTWSDLAAPAYAGWVAAADPTASGSTDQCLVLVLLKHGWEKGWGIALGILANSNGLLESSSHVSPSVSAGVALAGMEPEFVARMTIQNHPEALDYASPPAATAVVPDPITVLTGAPHLESARQFVEFVLSLQGQALWALPPEAPGGPPSQALHRYPVRPDVFEKYKDQLVVKGNPFTDQSDFQLNPKENQAYTRLVPHLVKAACSTEPYLLQKAWRQAAAAGPNSEALADLAQPPFDRAKAMEYADLCESDPARAEDLEGEWAEYFIRQYRKVLGMSSTSN